MPSSTNDWQRRKSADIRRRPSPQQGRALEILGHAIEYLLDRYVLPTSEGCEVADVDAAQLMMRLNLEIFRECPEFVPLYQRICRWISG